MKLGLGTVQFGMDYGILNAKAKTPRQEVKKILEIGAQKGIRLLDTASEYGTSEEVLGNTMPDMCQFKIVTKTPIFSKSCITDGDVRVLEETFYQSLTKLKQASLYGLLIHNPDDLSAKNCNLLIKRLSELKRYGLVKKIGVSVYTAEQIDHIMDKCLIDVIQLPVNVLDQRLLRTSHLKKLKRAGVEIHARSSLLQGLLLMDPDSLPPYFNAIKEHLKNYHKKISNIGLSPVQAALGFVMNIREVDIVLCGVNNHHQLQEILDSTTKPIVIENFEEFAFFDEKVLNPSQWRI